MIPGAYGYSAAAGEPRPLLEIRDGAAVVEGDPEPDPHNSVIFVEQAEPPRPVRSRFPARAGFGEVPDRSAAHDGLVEQLTEAVRAELPSGAVAAGVECLALGTRIEVTGEIHADGEVHPWVVPQQVVDLLRALRAVDHRPDTGAWTRASLVLDPHDPGLRTDAPAVQWKGRPLDGRDCYEELRYFPRLDAPAWLLERAWRYFWEHRHDEPEPEPVRMVRVFEGRDASGRPVAHRPALPWTEKQQVLDYLHDGQVLLSAPGGAEDELDPEQPPVVPKQFHTDGTWVWPLAMAHYLANHDVAPPRDFLDHIRHAGYRAPEVVAERAAAEAKALVLGTEVQEAVDPAEVMGLAQDFIGVMGMGRRFYSFEGPVEGGWSMVRGADGWWQVFCTHQGERQLESRFPDVHPAAAHLVGAMALGRPQFLRDPEEPLEDFECTVRPLPGEPPLAALDRKFEVVLRAGGEVDRFGPPTGNTAFAAGTTLPQRSAPPDRQPGEYRRYRVVEALTAVTGTVRPDHGQVGGGTAYVLPRSMAELVEGGWLAEL
ncbi:TNT domain-containing protein [Saccharopolyspora cebuensis]|uniref:TNT domain-containing protein n=1 Tax=Saccharopolyspora cebuensis TaxID=418759 RepID=A0ABV4CNF5_9PSEU